MDVKENKKINRLVNMIYSIQGDFIYFSFKEMIISNTNFKDSLKISKLPIFDSAFKILTILNENNIDFKEKDIKLINKSS